MYDITETLTVLKDLVSLREFYVSPKDVYLEEGSLNYSESIEFSEFVTSESRHIGFMSVNVNGIILRSVIYSIYIKLQNILFFFFSELLRDIGMTRFTL